MATIVTPREWPPPVSGMARVTCPQQYSKDALTGRSNPLVTMASHHSLWRMLIDWGESCNVTKPTGTARRQLDTYEWRTYFEHFC